MTMKKTASATDSQPQTALAAAPAGGTLALPTSDDLGDVMEGLEVVNDGLSELGSEDIKLASLVFNFKGKDAVTGRAIMPDTFFDTLTETARENVEAILLDLSKGNTWSSFDPALDKTVTHCRSFDQVTGTMADGTQRPCQGCPDAVWRTDDKGKRMVPCTAVYTVALLDTATAQPAIIRFKKTSLPVIKSHLQRHHIGRRVVKGARSNYPLFSFVVKLGLEMDVSGKYAVPTIDVLRVVTRDEARFASEGAKAYRETMLGRARELGEKMDEATASGVVGDPTSFDVDKFADSGPSDTTVMPATAAGGRW